MITDRHHTEKASLCKVYRQQESGTIATGQLQ